MNRNDVLAYTYASSYPNAYQELKKQWPAADVKKGNRHEVDDVRRQQASWLTLHDSINDGQSHDSSWCAVYSLTTDKGDVVTFGEYNNNAWGVIDLLEQPMTCKEYLQSWEEPPEEFAL